MAATETSSASSSVLRPLTRAQICAKLNLCLKKHSTANTPTKPSPAAVSHPPQKKRKCCLCDPTARPGRSFLCAVHRRLAKENIEILLLKAKRRRSGLNVKIGILGLKPKKRRRCCFTTSDSGLNLRKTVMMNSLAGIGSVEAEKCRKYLKESMVKPSSLRFRRVFRPRRTRFYALHDKDQV
ncbi:serine-rich protein-related [Raphanus sativus]|uniref:Uncharacterized protein LOC108815238 n=1 Tax=Raphanus sativus TaxID=3726 RepID=A0A6J0K7D5_RAPSA|nr:uncharacterized protein LOC108815238 [Raphanus sativus]KAJ4883541.1 serine-rich protein-related [Raphanus sativus]